MVNPDEMVFLHDILDACRNISEFTQGVSYDQFCQDKKTVSAVVRELAVIGEAARRVGELFRSSHPNIPWERIFGMRNKLVHDYMGVQLPIVWQTAQEDIPQLRQQVESLLDSNVAT